MKQGRKLDELETELNRQLTTKRDFKITTDHLNLNPGRDGSAVMEMLDDSGAQPKVITASMTDLAHRQIAEYLGMGQKYYNHCLADYPDLLGANVNGWFRRNPTERMVRTLDGNARAFLSNKYMRIDNFEVARAVLPALLDLPDVKVESCELTDSRMYIKAVNPRLQADVAVGDTVQSGILISNSEVGLGTVTVMPLVYRLVCTNGMVVNDAGIKRRHVGREMEFENDSNIYRQETLMAADKAFIMKLEDVVGIIKDDVKFNRVVKQMQDARGAKITGDVQGFVELTAKQFKLTDDETSGVFRHLIDDHDGANLYGLANAVTATSKDVKDYDRATELESIGFQVLTMPTGLLSAFNRDPLAKFSVSMSA